MLEFQKAQFLDLHFFTTLSDLPVQWCKLTLPWWFWATKVFLLASKISKIVCLLAQLGEQLLEKQILKIILGILW